MTKQSKKRQSLERRTLFGKGICMGVADIIPGVSGGTVALILGIYTELIDTIKNIQLAQVDTLLRSALSLWDKKSRTRLKKIASEMNLQFLLPIVFGIVFAVITSSYFIPQLLKTYPAQMDSLFLGLVLASVLFPYTMIKKKDVTAWVLIIFFAWVSYHLVSLPTVKMSGTLYFTFFSGAIAICAMILPGISGSYILQAMGEYEFILENLHQALRLEVNSIVVILAFVAGIILGITSFARMLSWCLHRYASRTLAALTGLMLGALKAVWPFQNSQTNEMVLPASFGSLEALCLFLFLTGVGVVGLLFVMNKRLGKTLIHHEN